MHRTGKAHSRAHSHALFERPHSTAIRVAVACQSWRNKLPIIRPNVNSTAQRIECAENFFGMQRNIFIQGGEANSGHAQTAFRRPSNYRLPMLTFGEWS
jgi:hypothetical protein